MPDGVLRQRLARSEQELRQHGGLDPGRQHGQPGGQRVLQRVGGQCLGDDLRRLLAVARGHGAQDGVRARVGGDQPQRLLRRPPGRPDRADRVGDEQQARRDAVPDEPGTGHRLHRLEPDQAVRQHPCRTGVEERHQQRREVRRLVLGGRHRHRQCRQAVLGEHRAQVLRPGPPVGGAPLLHHGGEHLGGPLDQQPGHVPGVDAAPEDFGRLRAPVRRLRVRPPGRLRPGPALLLARAPGHLRCVVRLQTGEHARLAGRAPAHPRRRDQQGRQRPRCRLGDAPLEAVEGAEQLLYLLV